MTRDQYRERVAIELALLREDLTKIPKKYTGYRDAAYCAECAKEHATGLVHMLGEVA